MKFRLKRLWRDRDGGESVEWPLLVGVLGLGIVAALVALRTPILELLQSVLDAIATVGA